MQRDVEICSTQSSYSRLYHWTQRDVEIVALSLVTVVSTTMQRDVEICSTQSSYSRLYHWTQRDVEIVALSLVTVVSTTVAPW